MIIVKRIFPLILFPVFLLLACSPTQNETRAPSVSPTQTGPRIFSTLVPAPGNGYPAGDSANDGVQGAGSPYPAVQGLPDDKNLAEGSAFVEKSEIIQTDQPVRVELKVEGTLPTPCHLLASKVSPPESDGTIAVRVFSRVDPALLCIQVLEPFEDSIPITDLKAGTYQIVLNGEAVGEFTLTGPTAYP
jgi:hypothetical protein